MIIKQLMRDLFLCVAFCAPLMVGVEVTRLTLGADSPYSQFKRAQHLERLWPTLRSACAPQGDEAPHCLVDSMPEGRLSLVALATAQIDLANIAEVTALDQVGNLPGEMQADTENFWCQMQTAYLADKRLAADAKIAAPLLMQLLAWRGIDLAAGVEETLVAGAAATWKLQHQTAVKAAVKAGLDSGSAQAFIEVDRAARAWGRAQIVAIKSFGDSHAS